MIIVNSNRREHPKGELEIEMLKRESVIVTGGEPWFSALRSIPPGEPTAIYQNGAGEIVHGESSGEYTEFSFQGIPALALKLRNFQVLPAPQPLPWVSPRTVWSR